MTAKNPSFARVLLIVGVLIVGPLQAQSVFACAMMDEVMHECCCVGQKPDHDSAVDANTDPCCEHSVTISIDEEARQNAPPVKPAEVRSDVDPPSCIVAPITEFDLLPQRVAFRVDLSPPDLCYSLADTYLITQRLRI